MGKPGEVNTIQCGYNLACTICCYFHVVTRYDLIKDYFEQYYSFIHYHTPCRVNEDLQCYWFLSEMKTRIKIP